MYDNLKHKKHVNFHGHQEQKRFTYKGFDVLISEGGPFHIRKNEYPNGFYESSYALMQNEKVLFYQPIEFDGLHDIKMFSNETRKLGRINAAIRAAKVHVDEFVKMRDENA